MRRGPIGLAYDRDEVLARTDLSALADDLLGPHKGRGRSASWSCPAPGHRGQTGKTPPLTIYTGANGDERWKCHACGAGGTAADLIMAVSGRTFHEALESLARRTGVGPEPEWRGPAHRVRPPTTPLDSVRAPSPEVERYVAACEEILWSGRGRAMRQWLSRRGLDEAVLRANRVGADPGPRSLDRADGLPRRGPGVVLPVLDPSGEALYFQTRYLRAHTHRYDNPASSLAGPSPRVAETRLARTAVRDDAVLVCEGIPDALTAAQAGYRAIAVLGAGYPDARVASGLLKQFPSERLVLAFDADERGRAGAEHLAVELSALGARDRVASLPVPGAGGDLNGWLQLQGDEFEAELSSALHVALKPRGLAESLTAVSPEAEAIREPPGATLVLESRSGSPPPPGHPLESLYYRFVLVDDPDIARTNAARIEAGLRDAGSGDHGVAATDGLDVAIETVRYTHLLAEGAGAADLIRDAVRLRTELERSLEATAPATSRALPDSVSQLAASPPEPPTLGVAL